MKKSKSTLTAIAGILLFAAGFLLMKTVPQPDGFLKTLPYLLIGVGCGMFGHGAGDIVNNKIRQKYPDTARQMDIDLNDERNITIGNRAKAKGFDMMTYVFGAVLLAFALMNAALDVILIFVIAYLFVQFYAVYYRIRLDKKM